MTLNVSAPEPLCSIVAPCASRLDAVNVALAPLASSVTPERLSALAPVPKLKSAVPTWLITAPVSAMVGAFSVKLAPDVLPSVRFSEAALRLTAPPAASVPPLAATTAPWLMPPATLPCASMMPAAVSVRFPPAVMSPPASARMLPDVPLAPVVVTARSPPAMSLPKPPTSRLPAWIVTPPLPPIVPPRPAIAPDIVRSVARVPALTNWAVVPLAALLSRLEPVTVRPLAALIVPPAFVSVVPVRLKAPPETRLPPALLRLPAALTSSPSAPDKAPPVAVERLPTLAASEPELAIRA